MLCKNTTRSMLITMVFLSHEVHIWLPAPMNFWILLNPSPDAHFLHKSAIYSTEGAKLIKILVCPFWVIFFLIICWDYTPMCNFTPSSRTQKQVIGPVRHLYLRHHLLWAPHWAQNKLVQRTPKWPLWLMITSFDHFTLNFFFYIFII